MNVVDQILELRQQGKSEQEIAKTLRDQGIPPKQITDALAKSHIKNNVPNIQNQDYEGMQPSIMPNEESQLPRPEQELQPPKPEQEEYSHEPKPYMPPEQPASFQEFQSQYPSQNYQQDFYQPQEYGYESESYDTDTIIDIAEQVFTEKMTEINKQIENLNEFKTMSQTRINQIEKRLERIESIIDKFQIAILQKISSYGENLNSIKNEMSMMQDSFSKMINPLIDKTTQTTSSSKIKKTPIKKTRGKKI